MLKSTQTRLSRLISGYVPNLVNASASNASGQPMDIQGVALLNVSTALRTTNSPGTADNAEATVRDAVVPFLVFEDVNLGADILLGYSWMHATRAGLVYDEAGQPLVLATAAPAPPIPVFASDPRQLYLQLGLVKNRHESPGPTVIASKLTTTPITTVLWDSLQYQQQPDVAQRTQAFASGPGPPLPATRQRSRRLSTTTALPSHRYKTPSPLCHPRNSSPSFKNCGP